MLKFQKTPINNMYQSTGDGYSVVIMKDYHLYMWHAHVGNLSCHGRDCASLKEAKEQSSLFVETFK